MKKIRYNNEMTGTIIAEDKDHFLIQFPKSKFCVAKNSIDKSQIYED